MNKDLDALKERLLSKLDIVDLIELLSISASDLVEAFEDRILNNYESISKEIDVFDGDQDWEDPD